MRRSRVWLVCGAVVVVSVAVTGYVRARGSNHEAAPATTARVQRGTVVSTVSAAGSVEALQSRSLSFATAGTLTEMNVRPGDVVATGAVLARIDSTSAQSAVESAQDSVDSAADNLDRAEEEAEAAEKATTAAATTASVSSNQPGAGAGAGAGGGANQGTQGNQASQGDQLTQSSTALMSAQQRLNNAKLALRQAQARLDGTVITAPVGGRILAVNGAVGAQAQSNVVVLAGDADVAVRAQFTEAEVAALAIGQTATIALPDRSDAALTGKVGLIDPAGTVSNRLVRYAAVITFDRVPDALLYGQSATVVVTTQAVEDVLYVPSTAVSDGAVTVKVGGWTERRAVGVGLRGDINTEIQTGLTEGDEVLISGG